MDHNDEQVAEVARLITSSVAGARWAELSPMDIARHLVANGVEVVRSVSTEAWTCEHGVVAGEGCEEYGCGDTAPAGTGAEQAVARLDGYTQERHREELRVARDRIERRREIARRAKRGIRLDDVAAFLTARWNEQEKAGHDLVDLSRKRRWVGVLMRDDVPGTTQATVLLDLAGEFRDHHDHYSNQRRGA